jgi:hypothetical protein
MRLVDWLRGTSDSALRIGERAKALEAADALETAEAENRELRQIIASLGYCTADASLEFMRLIPDEVRLEKIRSGR